MPFLICPFGVTMINFEGWHAVTISLLFFWWVSILWCYRSPWSTRTNLYWDLPSRIKQSSSGISESVSKIKPTCNTSWRQQGRPTRSRMSVQTLRQQNGAGNPGVWTLPMEPPMSFVLSWASPGLPVCASPALDWKCILPHPVPGLWVVGIRLRTSWLSGKLFTSRTISPAQKAVFWCSYTLHIQTTEVQMLSCKPVRSPT